MPKRKRKTNQATAAETSSAPEESSVFKCFVCKTDCQTDTNLENHIATKHGPRFNCQCAHCTGKRRHDSAKLVEENILKDREVDVKLFKCIVCEYQVFLLCKCLSHIQTTHNTVALQKQYECMKCNIGFEQCMDLHSHIQTHTNAQRIARCGFSHCKKCFTTAALLQNHLRHNHKITKPYELLSNIKGSLVNPKAPNMQPPAPNVQPKAPNIQQDAPIPKPSSSSSVSSSASSSTSAWLAPDPPSPPPADPDPAPTSSEPTAKEKKSESRNLSKTQDKEENSFDPDLACPHCKKPHKSQASLNNHLHLFHKEKIVNRPKKRRRGFNADSDVSSDWTSEDSDWEPGNNHSKRNFPRSTRSSKKPSSGSDSTANANKTKENTEPPSELPVKSTDPTPEPDAPAKANSDPEPPHEDHQQNNGRDDCLACQQQSKKSTDQIPVVKIKQEPIDSDMTMPVISNVFSMTSGATGNAPNGYTAHYQAPPISGSAYSTASASSTVQFNQHFESGDERPGSTGSSLHNGSSYSTASTNILTPNRGNNCDPSAGSPASNPSPSTGWQPAAAIPADQAASRDECANCLDRKPSTNKCIHCGIIFLEPTMHMIHMGWHGEKMPFQCHTCGLICNDKYSFTTHIFKAQHL